MVSPEKIDLVKDISQRLGQCQSVVLSDFRGLDVAEMSELRSRLREKNVQCKVLKNRLAKRAVADAECDSLDEFLSGNTLWAFGIDDPVDPAKILAEFAKDHSKLILKGGLLESKKIDAEGVKQLAAMPGRAELLSMIAGGMMQPAVKLVSAMNAGMAKMALAFAALAEKKEQAGET